MNLVPGLDFFHLALYRAGADGGARLAVRADQHDRLRHGAAGAEQRRHRAVQHGAQRVRRLRHLDLHRLVTDHQQIRQAHLVDHLSPATSPTTCCCNRCSRPGRCRQLGCTGDAQLAPGQVFQMLQAQVAVLAYNDVFLITGCVACHDPDGAADVRRQAQAERRGALSMRRRAMAAPGLLIAGGACTVGPDFKPSPPGGATGTTVRAGRSLQPGHEAATPTRLVEQLQRPGADDADRSGDRRQPGPAAGGAARRRGAENVVSARAAGLPTLSGTGSYTREQLGAARHPGVAGRASSS